MFFTPHLTQSKCPLHAIARRKILISFFVVFQACDIGTVHSYKEYEAVFKKIKFDIGVIDKISLYDSLQKLVFKNLDKTLPKKKVYISNHSITDLSDFDSTLGNSFQQLFMKIGKDYIQSFSLTNDTIFSIIICTTYSKEISITTEQILELRADKNKEPNTYPFAKDTLINKKWTYRIWTDAKNDI